METQEETGDKPDAPGDVPHNENIALRSTTTDFNLVVLHTCRVLASIVFVILAGLWGLVTSCTAVLASGLNAAVLAGLSTLILCWGLLIKWISRQLLPRAARKRGRPFLLLLLLGGGAFTASYLMLSDQFILNMVGVQVYIVAVLILGTLVLITRVRFHWVSYVTVGMAVAICPSIVFYYGEGACHTNMVTHLRWGRFKELISQSTDLYAPINNSLKMVQFRHEAINMNPSIYWDPNGVDEQSVLVVRALMGTENKGFLFPHECALFLDSRLLARAPSQVQWFVIIGKPDYD